MTAIEELIKRLSDKPNVYIEIADVDSRQKLSEEYLNLSQIKEKYPSVNAYINSFGSETIQEVFVTPLVKHGKKFRREYPINVDVSLLNTNNDEAINEPIMENNTTAKEQVTFLGGGMKKDLSLDDYLMLRQNTTELARIQKEFTKLETKYKSEKKKRKSIQSELAIASKQGILDGTSGEMIKEGAPMLLGIIKDMATAKNGLGKPQENISDGLSEVKKDFVKKILRNEKVTDKVTQDSLGVLWLMATNSAFNSALTQLVEQHQIIE